MSEGVRTHWQVVSRTYPQGRHAGEAVTEFEFANGVTVQYEAGTGSMYIHLHVPESYLSTGASTETLREGDVLVNVDRTDGALTGIEIIRSEGS